MPRTTVTEALRHGAIVLRDAGIDNPAREARLLLAHLLGWPAEKLLAASSTCVDTAAFHALLARRAAHEPMAYITGLQGFWSLEFRVSRATLIPRPDSETVVEVALALPPPTRVLDLGTGTGCLLLSVLHERPAAFGVGVDLSPDAARLARANARHLGLESRAAFLCGDWAAAVAGRFDLVLSNPPYIEAATIPCLMPDVAHYEPRRALDGGPDGLNAYRAIVAVLPRLLTDTGSAVLELGVGQGPDVARLAGDAGFATRLHPDLAGIDRAITLRREAGRGATATGSSATIG